ncbi:MAG: signal transduction histidine kinase/CheY-like chemotaxis protein [Polyangiales bacterium]|jgi:signal transduction histidine kinase/CheY-like chemotaxis protein
MVFSFTLAGQERPRWRTPDGMAVVLHVDRGLESQSFDGVAITLNPCVITTSVHRVVRQEEASSDASLWVSSGPNPLAVTIANQLIRAFPNELEDVLQSTIETTARALGATTGAISLIRAAPEERQHITWHGGDEEVGTKVVMVLNASLPPNTPLLVPDLSKWSGADEFIALAKEGNIGAFVSTPLVAQGTCIGRYVFGWSKSVGFDSNHVEFARFVAQVTSSAIDRVRGSRMKQRRRSLDELLTSASADFADVPLDGIPSQIGVTLRNICGTLNLDFSSAVVFEDPSTRAPLELGRWPVGESEPQDELRAAYFLSPQYIRRHQESLSSLDAVLNLGLGTLIEVPLVNEGRVFGSVVFGCESDAEWKEQERRILRLIAEVMGRSWIQSRAQAELERTERAFEAIEDGLWEWPDVKNRRQWWSSRMYGLLGYAQETPATVDAMYARIHPDDLERLRSEYQECIAREETLHVDVRHIDGYWLRFRGRPIEGNGRGLAGSLQDISKERNAEAGLVHAQKMETVGVLAGGIAHDFNNLLTAFTNCTRLAMEDIAEGRSDEAQERLAEALEVTDRAAALTRQLLTFSRRQTIQSRSLDFGELVTNIIKLLRRLLPESITIRWNRPAETLPIHGDPGQLEQVIVNLCVNAGDAMPNGGSLDLRASSLSLSTTKAAEFGLPQGAYIRLSIADTGRGMPAEVALRATEPFYTTKKQGEGTGLGLSMAYGIVDQHEGLLSLESEVGAGTTISVFLPRGPELTKSAVSNRAPKPKPAGGSEHILVVEDDEMVLRTVVRILRRAGYEVSVARNGRLAIELFQENPDRYQLAFLDVIMPEMDGSEACRQMLEVRPNLKFLFSTGYAAGMLDETLQGERTLLAKPYAATDLLQKIRGLLDESV